MSAAGPGGHCSVCRLKVLDKSTTCSLGDCIEQATEIVHLHDKHLVFCFRHFNAYRRKGGRPVHLVQRRLEKGERKPRRVKA